MPDVVIEIEDRQAREALARLKRPDLLQTAVEAAGAEVRKAAIEHFRNREKAPENTSGFPKFGQAFGKKGFWSGTRGTSVAEAVGAPAWNGSDGTVTIPIDSPALAHKADPNPPPIKPKGGRQFLAIPANARAAAWAGMPKDFPVPGGMKMAIVPTPEGRSMHALVAQENFLRTIQRGRRAGERVVAAAGKATTGAMQPQFWLVRKVMTKHDPYAMPSRDVLTLRAIDRVNAVVARLSK